MMDQDKIRLSVTAHRQHGRWMMIVEGPSWVLSDMVRECRERGGWRLENWGGTEREQSFMIGTNYTEAELEEFKRDRQDRDTES